MRIAILSRGPRLYSTRRLKEAAEARGHDARVLNPLSCSIEVAHRSPRLYYKNKKLSSYDAVIPRIGASITFFGTAVLRQFEQMGTFCVNPSHAISVSRDKLRALQVLSRHNIGIPTTLFVRHVSEILPGIERMGGPPVVVKLLEGTQGIGVILADSTKVAEAIIETLAGPAKMSVLLQQFVSESKGRDIRALVVGNRVVAAMRRTASGDDFRSNLHRGGSAEIIKLDKEYERTAVHAAQILGLRVAGVDLLEGRHGPILMEVNSSPGLEGIETSTGVDVAGEIVTLIEEQVLFPEIDIRQRLTLESGYGVMEIPVAPSSELCGKTIKSSQLRERDVLVLTIQRGSITIPNPRVDREIMAGDVLLCFGKNLTLKGLAPPRPRKKKKKKKGESAKE
ncbi:MAG: 30S ribosomal protein S6--L-glutamate ligase [Myxococcota bacterium]